jgi:plastocyanin
MLKPIILAVFAALLSLSPPSEHIVGQNGKRFSTSALQAKVGDTVTFKNDDTVSHNVFSSTENLRFNLKSQAPGTSNSVVLDTEGTAEIRCAFHPTMRMTITVTR